MDSSSTYSEPNVNEGCSKGPDRRIGKMTVLTGKESTLPFVRKMICQLQFRLWDYSPLRRGVYAGEQYNMNI
ncbi:MAG: hypothetical protein QIT35_gp85 [Methanophagales virus PBV299]|uniref:Uncharacterized protein n=1 Tax=Methanophagales virus PBV299 TaxID=2987730 RepID=A0ABY6GLK2_9CAUD|nr:MAG: hypothetical protein QIT35_gp85 [Methanophagales virus PBV299]UYL64881.1 MAG: hypothetical protein OFDIEDLO_00085 [Methanophagales virus PBV299]